MQGGGEERKSSQLVPAPRTHCFSVAVCVCWRIEEKKVKRGREMPAGLLKSLCFCCWLLEGRLGVG